LFSFLILDQASSKMMRSSPPRRRSPDPLISRPLHPRLGRHSVGRRQPC
jgi:hypothetical protein